MLGLHILNIKWPHKLLSHCIFTNLHHSKLNIILDTFDIDVFNVELVALWKFLCIMDIQELLKLIIAWDHLKILFFYFLYINLLKQESLLFSWKINDIKLLQVFHYNSICHFTDLHVLFGSPYFSFCFSPLLSVNVLTLFSLFSLSTSSLTLLSCFSFLL